jgi:hypothetical protein
MTDESEREDTRFKLGNQFWKLAPNIGRKPIWENPEEMRAACEEYFEHVISTPFWDNQVISFQGVGTDHPVEKMRAMTIDGLCVFLGIARSTWRNYRTNPVFMPVTEYVESVMFDYKLTGAAAGFLNANIIIRDLGLKDSAEIDHRSGDGSMTPAPTIDATKLSTDTLKELFNARTSGTP